MGDPQKSIYQPLRSDEIRLLNLDPGPPETTLRCSLEVISLKQIGSYEALSYTWGLDMSDNVISLNTHSVPVTRNLYEALQALRFISDPRKLWIDALCINQGDLQERASQVNIMRQIYKEASDVIVWLGPKAGTSDLALDLLQKLSNIRGEKIKFGPYGVILREDLSKAGLPDFLEPDWAAVNSLLSRSWFSRVWVIQEVAVSKVACIRCGDREMGWDVMANACRAIHEAQLVVVLEEGYKHVVRLQAFREVISASGELPLLTLLMSSQACLATDPRDKIFAMLGMASDVMQAGRGTGISASANYTKPAAQVFTEITRAYISHYDFLDILSCKVFEEVREGLPSWVPDWSKDPHCTPLMLRQNPSGYCASQGFRAECTYSDDGRKLQISGIIFDEVSKVGRVLLEPGPDQNIDDVNIFCEWATLAEGVISYPSGTSVDTAFMLTLIANSNNLASKASDDYLAASLSWYRWLYRAKGMSIPEYLLETQLDQNEENARATFFHTAVMRVCYGRSYFLTEAGYMGIGPFHVKPGNLVCIARGASVPLILDETRKFIGGSDSQPLHVFKERRFVGESYIHGLMDGERYDESQLDQISLS